MPLEGGARKWYRRLSLASISSLRDFDFVLREHYKNMYLIESHSDNSCDLNEYADL